MKTDAKEAQNGLQSVRIMLVPYQYDTPVLYWYHIGVMNTCGSGGPLQAGIIAVHSFLWSTNSNAGMSLYSKLRCAKSHTEVM